MKSEKREILIVINDFYVGGAQRLVAEQIKFFNKDKININLITLINNSNRANLYDTLPPNLPVFKIGMRHSYNIIDLIRLIRTVNQIKPDIVVSHLFLSNTLMRSLKLFFKYRIFTVEHNTYIKKKKWEIFVDRILSLFSEKIIAVSKQVADFIVTQQGVSKDKVIVIPNGINLETINEYKLSHTKTQARSRLKIDNQAKVFLSVGRVTAQKNQELLIMAFKHFHLTHPGARLYILGEGALMGELQKISVGDEAIHLMGNVSNVNDYYRAADFLVSTSIIEGMSMAYIEALAFGLPVISTRTGGTSELIHDGSNGVIIETFYINSVVSAMSRALECDYNELSSCAVRTANDFSILHNVRGYESLFLKKVVNTYYHSKQIK